MNDISYHYECSHDPHAHRERLLISFFFFPLWFACLFFFFFLHPWISLFLFVFFLYFVSFWEYKYFNTKSLFGFFFLSFFSLFDSFSLPGN